MISLSLPMRAKPITMPASTATGKVRISTLGSRAAAISPANVKRQIGVERELGKTAGLLRKENGGEQRQREQHVR